MTHPKVFLSHASEDKERFVDEFATRLTENGVDVWLDKWEMLPGDSLVDKIFEEGLKQSEAVIIVLSDYSVQKPWVREELNSTIINRIQKGTKLIPVVIDECEVPEPLKSTLWETIKDKSCYDSSFERILASIFGASLKPNIGQPPSYTLPAIHQIEGLEPVDNLVLKQSCDSLNEWPDDPIEPEEIFNDNNSEAPPKEQVLESLEILEDQGYISISHYIGGGPEHWGCHYRVTLFGYEEYCKAYVPEYGKMQNSIVGAIVNENIYTNHELSKKLNIHLSIVTHVLRFLEQNDFLKTSGEIGNRVAVHSISAKLRRAMQ
ncbi:MULTISPECIES: TIR domain-containing protein [unclassified Modicisalibacter]|uniref:TIR domain-containing protein n=1 Tax=unclassified Modicisalibacter TaxID=2679913 RepID=UPI001CD00417|nr:MULTISPECIES: TIR domain-containing protein [unclassified Modicisalibacter]MBZ9559084.1 TIR domain-containing protein [Modicisalibacter sp. R2A 31.J]MBZ9576805.1 TIR domain-containing protein [Modicisalibacter sp. MOD 31.J]